MMVQEKIPAALRSEVEAVLAWFNKTQTSSYIVTGIVDPEVALEAPVPRLLHLVLCSGTSCEQRTFRVTMEDGGLAVESADTQALAPAVEGVIAELDPPSGPRRAWLGRAFGEQAFVLLLFYRGFW